MTIKSILIILGLVFCAPQVMSAQVQNFSYKIKILKKEERQLYGGLGKTDGAMGCSLNIFIMTNSSLSFPCGAINNFRENWIYVYSEGNSYYVCPQMEYIKSKCLNCPECATKVNEMKMMNVVDKQTENRPKL